MTCRAIVPSWIPSLLVVSVVSPDDRVLPDSRIVRPFPPCTDCKFRIINYSRKTEHNRNCRSVISIRVRITTLFSTGAVVIVCLASLEDALLPRHAIRPAQLHVSFAAASTDLTLLVGVLTSHDRVLVSALSTFPER